MTPQTLMAHARAAERYEALVMRTRYIARYGAFLLDCIRQASRSHTPEEVAAAEEHLRRPVNVPQLDLLLGKGI